MKTKTINILCRLLVTFFVVCTAMPALADWGQAESPDFTLDTTIPEPALMLAAVLALWLLRRRK